MKTTAFDLQLNPANPGMSFHKLDKAKDKIFWSVRINRDIRLIVHKSDASLLLCYVGHHDEAYDWAERRKLETHPKTGAAHHRGPAPGCSSGTHAPRRPSPVDDLFGHAGQSAANQAEATF